jgi:hypothetical protein
MISAHTFAISRLLVRCGHPLQPSQTVRRGSLTSNRRGSATRAELRTPVAVLTAMPMTLSRLPRRTWHSVPYTQVASPWGQAAQFSRCMVSPLYAVLLASPTLTPHHSAIPVLGHPWTCPASSSWQRYTSARRTAPTMYRPGQARSAVRLSRVTLRSTPYSLARI